MLFRNTCFNFNTELMVTLFKLKKMATFDGTFYRGRIGNKIYRVVRGKQVVSEAQEPGTRKMSKTNINSCNTFGMSTSLAGSVRLSVKEDIGGYRDGQMVNRLNSAIVKAIKQNRDEDSLKYTFDSNSFNSLKGVEFNENSPFKSLLPIHAEEYQNNNTVTIKIPEVSIPRKIGFPEDTYQCKVVVNKSTFRIWDGLMAEEPESQSVTITRSDGILEEKTFHFSVPDGCLHIFTVFLEYSKYRNNSLVVINRKNFHPGGIISAVLTPGDYNEVDSLDWISMVKFEK